MSCEICGKNNFDSISLDGTITVNGIIKKPIEYKLSICLSCGEEFYNLELSKLIYDDDNMRNILLINLKEVKNV